MSAQSQQLDNHLHSEDHGEDHVEDVHDGGEELGLLVMLEEGDTRALSNGPPLRTVKEWRGGTWTASVSVFPRISTNMTYSNWLELMIFQNLSWDWFFGM